MNAQLQAVALDRTDMTPSPEPMAIAPSTALTPTQMAYQLIAGGASLEAVEKMLDMTDRLSKDQARRAFDAAVAAAGTTGGVHHRRRRCGHRRPCISISISISIGVSVSVSISISIGIGIGPCIGPRLAGLATRHRLDRPAPSASSERPAAASPWLGLHLRHCGRGGTFMAGSTSEPWPIVPLNEGGPPS